jgi:hypothetical protein
VIASARTLYVSQAWKYAAVAAAEGGDESGGGSGAAASASTSALSQDKRMQIAYNAGLAALLAGQYTAALGCFQARSNPVVWELVPHGLTLVLAVHHSSLTGGRL